MSTQHPFAMGLLPHVPDPRDLKLCARRLGVLTVPPVIDLSLADARDQQTIGWCYSMGARAAAQRLYFQQTGELWEPSPRFNAIMTKYCDRGLARHEEGATGRATIKALVKAGMVDEADFPWPKDLSDLNDVWSLPPSAALSEGQERQILKYYWIIPGSSAPAVIDQALASGHGVMIGLALRQPWMEEEAAVHGVIEYSTGPYVGGHMMWIDGRKPGYKQLLNSWGPDWGVKSPAGFRGHVYVADAVIASSDVMFLAVLTDQELGE